MRNILRKNIMRKVALKIRRHKVRLLTYTPPPLISLCCPPIPAKDDSTNSFYGAGNGINTSLDKSWRKKLLR